MSFGESLTEIRKSKGISRKDLAEKLDIPYTTLRNYETNQREPGHKLLIKIATLLSVSVDELVGYHAQTKIAPPYTEEALKLAKDYDDLDGHGKKVVRLVADEEKARCAAPSSVEPQAEEKVIYIFPGYASPMSAGTGQPAGDEYPENYRLVKEPPRGASFIAPVSGGSMEPTYSNGDLVFVRAQEEVEVGEIGVFWMDGQQWIKERGDGELISHNPDYGPRPMTEGIRCQGLVLCVCDESYLE